MKESQFSFQYSEKDLEPIRLLYFTMIAIQVVAALAGAIWHWFSNLGASLVVSAFLASLPGYLVGLYVQTVAVPGSLGHNAVMVRRLGLLAAFFTVMGLSFLFGQ